jgi:hypothetical protein
MTILSQSKSSRRCTALSVANDGTSPATQLGLPGAGDGKVESQLSNVS